MTSPSIMVSLPRELVERLVPGAIADAEKNAEEFGELERESWVAGNLGVFVAHELADIKAASEERREILLKLLDHVAAEP